MKYCEYCGTGMPDDAKFCPACEAPQKDAGVTFAEYTMEDEEEETPAPEAAETDPDSYTADDFDTENTGAKASDDGQERPVREQPASAPARESRRKASVLSVIAFICTVLLITAPVGVVLAIIDLVKSRTQPRKKGFSIAALVISGVLLLIGVAGNTFLRKEIQQSVNAPVTGSAPAPAADPRTDSPKSEETVSSRDAAVMEAKNELDWYHFCSPALLKSQLTKEGYSEKDAAYAVSHCDADWTELIYDLAYWYLGGAGCSKEELLTMLRDMEEFSEETVRNFSENFANTTIDFRFQAYKSAKEYLETNPEAKRQELTDYLLSKRMYTGEEASFAAEVLFPSGSKEEVLEAANQAMRDDRWLPPRSLKEELTAAGYSEEDAAYAVMNCDVDWQKMALDIADTLFASDYGYSTNQIQDVFMELWFTQEEVEYAVTHWTVDKKQEAIEIAARLLREGKTESEINEEMWRAGFIREVRENALKKLNAN